MFPFHLSEALSDAGNLDVSCRSSGSEISPSSAIQCSGIANRRWVLQFCSA